MKQRLFSLLTLLILLVPILAACGGETATEVPADTGAATEVPAVEATAEPVAEATEEPATEATLEPIEEATEEPTDNATEEPAGGDNVLRVHQAGYPDIFDPQKSSFSSEIVIMAQNYEGLTRLNENLESTPAAAESWEYNEDATVITFTLRPDLTYSDGSPLTAENFVYAAMRTCDPETAGQYQSILFDLAGCAELASTAVTDTEALEAARANVGVTAVDEQTLVMEMAQPAPYFHTVAGLWVMYPAKQELIEAGGDNWWQQAENHIGNGPFQITSIDEGQRIQFERNENYWNPAALDGIEYIYIEDSAVALEAFRQGQIDIMTVDPSQIPAVEGDAELSEIFLRYPAATTTVLDFNLTKPPFDDPKVREAFAYALDRETYCEIIRNGDCSPTLTWIPEGIPGYDAEEDRFTFDPEAAQQALAESTYGSADALPEITMAYNSNDPANQARHEFIATNFRDVLGVEITLEPQPSQDFSAARKDVETRRQMNLGGWIGDYPDPQNWLSVYWRCDAFAKRQGYCNEEADALMTQGDTSTDMEERLGYYQQAQDLVVGDLPSAMFYNPSHIFLVQPYVQNYSQTAADDQWPGQWTPATVTLNK